MTIQGRTTEKWGRDKSARWDPGPTNRWRSYPAVVQRGKVVEIVREAKLSGRPGFTEREFEITFSTFDHLTPQLNLSLEGWLYDDLSLNERQIAFLRDTLNDWFPKE